MEKFLIPVHLNENVYTHGELKKLKGGVIADAKKASGDMAGIIRSCRGGQVNLSVGCCIMCLFNRANAKRQVDRG